MSKCLHFGCRKEAMPHSRYCLDHKEPKKNNNLPSYYHPVQESDKDFMDGVKRCDRCGFGKCQATNPHQCLVKT